MLTVENVIIEPPREGEMFDPDRWFEGGGPFELEIGSGKGGFLVNRALARPDVRLLGIEWASKYYRLAAERMARRGLANVRLMRTDAGHFVIHHLPPACVDLLHLYHPDPWPKKRHHKRRLMQSPFVEAAVRVLRPGAMWRVQSDHAEYFEQIRGLLLAHPALTEVPWEGEVILPEDWAGTNFEVKYAREGRTIYRLAFRKSGQ